MTGMTNKTELAITCTIYIKTNEDNPEEYMSELQGAALDKGIEMDYQIYESELREL